MTHHDDGEPLPHQLKEAFFKHANLPQNLGRLDHPQGKATGIGSCGDSIEVHLAIVDHRIDAIRHTPKGCIYTTACASAMSKLACGRQVAHALTLTPEEVADELGGLPADHRHCAALAVNTLGEAIDDYLQYHWGARRQPSETPMESLADNGSVSVEPQDR